MAIAGELPEGGTQKATFRKGAKGPADQRGSAGGDQGGTAGDGGEAGAVKVRPLPLDTPRPVGDTVAPYGFQQPLNV